VASAETGEITTAVLVSSTKTKEYAHAAEQLLTHTAFAPAPAAMDLETWPAKDAFWVSLFGKDIGHLGLFHFLGRIIKTLPHQNHTHFHKALKDLLAALYKYHPPDYVKALKNGTLNGIHHNEIDIEELQQSKNFCERYNKYFKGNKSTNNKPSKSLFTNGSVSTSAQHLNEKHHSH
jgi:hypothetical protein